MKEYFTFPAREEIKAATNICCGRFCGSCETPVEYAWRARDVDMSALLDMAIENELTQAEQKAVADGSAESGQVEADSDKADGE